jgi:hypothetical protein
VAEAQLPAVAAGDFHRIAHLAGWKTLLPCGKDEQAIVACLRSRAMLHLAPFSPVPRPPVRASSRDLNLNEAATVASSPRLGQRERAPFLSGTPVQCG